MEESAHLVLNANSVDLLTDPHYYLHYVIADAASEPEASEQVSSSNSYWALKVRFYFRFADQNALLLTDQNAAVNRP